MSLTALAPRFGRRSALALGLSLLAAACRSKGEAPREKPSPRVVSLSPSTTEAAFAIGAGALLVGRSSTCDFPKEALALPSVGGFASPSVEAIIALRPTLVIGARGPAGPSLEDTLRARSIETLFPETESIAQVEAMLRMMGDALGAQEGAAKAIAAIQKRVDEVDRAVADRPKIKAILIFDVAPIFVAGPGSFPDELLRRAGGDNVIKQGGAYPTVGIEHVLALDPDVILDGASHGEGSGGVAAMRESAGWKEMRAVREGRIRVLDTSAALRPGPRIGEGLAAFARALHEGIALSPSEVTP